MSQYLEYEAVDSEEARTMYTPRAPRQTSPPTEAFTSTRFLFLYSVAVKW